jgi:hypothetical protein
LKFTISGHSRERLPSLVGDVSSLGLAPPLEVFFVIDAHRDDGKRFVVRSDEKLTAFLEAEKVTRDSPQTAVNVAIAAKARK